MVPLHRVLTLNVQGGFLTIFRGRDSLNVGNDVRPITPKVKEALEEWIEVRQIFGQYGIVYATGEQCTTGHQKELFYGIGEGTGYIVCEDSTANVIETILLPGIGEGRSTRLAGEHPCSKQCCITATGNIYCTIRVFFIYGLQLPQDPICFEQAGLHENKLRIPAAPKEEGTHFFLTLPILR